MMKPAVIDTDILSWFFRGHESVVSRFSSYLAVYDKINLSIITYYEILSGLKYKDVRKQLSTFLAFAKCNNIILLTEESVARSAEVYAQMRRQGTPVHFADKNARFVITKGDILLVFAGSLRQIARYSERSPVSSPDGTKWNLGHHRPKFRFSRFHAGMRILSSKVLARGLPS